MSGMPERLPQSAMPLLEIDVLRTFVSIAESGSFTRTAARVCRGLKTWANFVDAAEETLGQGSEGRFLNDWRDCSSPATARTQCL